jgi:hypothetical protein
MRALHPLTAAAVLWACAAAPVAPRVAPLAAELAAGDAAGAPAQLVLISVGGLTPERYLDGAGMPTLAALAVAGVAAEGVEAVAPAAVYPAHATLVTGVAPAQHGVLADQLLGERGIRRAQPRHASRLRAPTLWQRVAESGGSVAAFDWPTTTGAQIASLLPDVTPERSNEHWQALAAEAATPWIAERIAAAPAEVAEPGAARDTLLVDLACAALAQSPRLVLLRLRGAEVWLAAEGPRGAEVGPAFERLDQELARLVRCAARSGRLAETALVVVGDRALLATHTALRPNAWLRDEGLVGAQGRWTALARSNGGSAFVYASDAKAALRARKRLDEAARETSAFRVVSAEEMIQRKADRDAWFGLEAEPGFVFEDTVASPAIAPARERGAGGYLDGDAAQRTGFVAFGRGVRRGLDVPRMSQLDIAPTLAALLGVPLEPTSGRALVGLLRVGPAGARAHPVRRGG